MSGKSFSTIIRILIICGFIIVPMQFIAGCKKKTASPTSVESVPANTNTFAEENKTEPEVITKAKIDDMQNPVASADDWPWWRGPMGDNVCQSGQKPPMQWSETENILWQVELPGQGNGTPCIFGDRIFVAIGDKTEKRIWLLCLNRDSGDQIWEKEIYQGEMAKVHGDNSYAAATPACDGKRVYFPYQTDGEIRLAALSLNGEIVWDELLTLYTSIQGFSASPFFYKSAVIVTVDGKENNKLIARHRESGKVIWQVDVPGDHENYASAMLFNVSGREQVILVGPDDIRSYDPDTGENIWECDGPAQCYVAVAVADETTVYATGGYPKKALLAIKADGTGNVTETHFSWKSDNKASYVPSPLLHEGLLYNVNDKGLFRCYQASTGKIIWEEKLKGGFYSSPVLVGDKLYLFDKKGKGYICKAGESFEMLAENELPHGSFATPVVCNNRIYLRTLKTLYCIASGGNN